MRLGARELEGLRAYYELAFRNGLVQCAGTPVFYRRSHKDWLSWLAGPTAAPRVD